MSAHYSKYGLNTYYAVRYFRAHVPADYQLGLVLIKSRAFHRLPPRLRELAALAKLWTCRTYPENPAGIQDIERWYDADGYELDPGTGHRLTDEEIDDQWSGPSGGQGADLAAFVVEDIPLPAGGFADPEAWEPAPVEDTDLVDRDGLTETQILSDIASRGRKATAEEYGVPANWYTRVTSDEGLARMILSMDGKPWPVSTTGKGEGAGK